MLIGTLWVRPAATQPTISAPIQVTRTQTLWPEREPAVAAHGDRMIAVWHGRDIDQAVGWAVSVDRGRSWSHGGILVAGEPDQLWKGHAVCADSGGNLYLAARTVTASGYNVATYRGSFVGANVVWQWRAFAVLIPYGPYPTSGPDHMQLLCEPSGSPLYLIYTETGAVLGAEGTVKLVRSFDGGLSWSAPLALSGPSSDHSRAVLGPEGELYVVWLDRTLAQILGRKSTDRGESFGATFVVAGVEEDRSGPPGWGPSGRNFPSYPFLGGPRLLSLAVDRSEGPSRGRLYVAWTERASGSPAPGTGGAGEVEPNNTRATATPVTIGKTVSGSMYGQECCPSITDCDWFTFEGQAGTTLYMTGHACGSSVFGPKDGMGFTLWCESDSVGLFPISGASIHCQQDYQARVFTLPATGRYYLDMRCQVEGSISYSVFLGELEISPSSVAQDHRDVVLAASGDGGTNWSARVRANDDVGYDNSHPVVAVDRGGRVHVAWYDRREEPECAAKVHTRWSYSEDGGQKFVPSVRLSTEAVDLEAIRGGESKVPWVVGDYMALEAIGDEVQAFWVQPLPRTSTKTDVEGDLWSAVIRSDVPTPVLMPVAGFRAEVRDGAVGLRWELMEAPGALAVTGFRVERAAGESMEYAPLGSDLLPARGAGPYEVVDREVTFGKRYRYRLEVVLAGGSLWQGPVEVELPGASARPAWQWASPNPFTDSIVLELAIPHAARGVVAVYTATGREVTRLHQGWLAPGLQSLRWDGRDRRGRVVPAGIYLVRAVVGDAAVTRRVARIQ